LSESLGLKSHLALEGGFRLETLEPPLALSQRGYDWEATNASPPTYFPLGLACGQQKRRGKRAGRW
jgi:hypothetical protein